MQLLMILGTLVALPSPTVAEVPPAVAQESAVRRTVTKWLTHTRKREWSSMVGMAPRDWVTHNGPRAAAAAKIADYYHNVQLASWKIREARQASETRFLVVVDVEASNGPTTLMITVIRERGKWLIDPETAVIK